jgi:hypothetical protein
MTDRQLAFRLTPSVAFYEVDVEEATELLIRWRHPLHLPTDQCPSCGKPHPEGRPIERPYGKIAYVMEDHGRRAGCAVLASTINPSVCKARGLHRYNTVDLCRIGRSPDRRDTKCLRAVLRITREYLVPEWLGRFEGWDALSAEMCGGRPLVTALAAQSMPGTPGHLYKFDGFELIRVSKGPKGGGRQKPSAANAIADGARGLWVYSYPQPLRGRLPAAA